MEACLKEVTKALLEVRCRGFKRAGPLSHVSAVACAVERERTWLARRRVAASPVLGLRRFDTRTARAQSDVNVGLVVQMKKARPAARTRSRAPGAGALAHARPRLRRTLSRL